MSKEQIKKEDLVEIYDLAWKQLKEDREEILQTLKTLKELTRSDMQGMAVLGDNLVKLTEVMIKQTAQVVELIKVAQRDKDEESEQLSSEDLNYINEEIKQ